MLPYFNRTGTYIVVIGGLLINLILALEFSYLGFFSFLFQGLPAFFRELTFKKLLGLLFSPFSKLKKTPQTKIVTYQNQPLAEVEPPVGVEPSEIEYEEGEPEDAETMAEENVPEENVEEVYYETEPEDLPPLPPEDVPPAQGAQAIEYMEDDPASELEESIEAQSIHEDPVIVEPSAQARVKKKKNSRLNFDYVRPRGNFKLPTLNLLADSEIHEEIEIDRETLLQNSKILEQKLKDFNVEGRVVEVRPGPVITVYEFEPAAGVKVSRIVNLADDLSLALSALSVRIVAPIPGKSVVGIELPNDNRQLVKLKEILLNNEFKSLKYRLPLALGKSISGEPLIADLARMPHLLVAGATGSGKSVFINSLICSFLFRYTPDQLRFLMIDPKMLELSMYDKIPHLLLPVVTDPKKAAQALKWAVLEMEKRYTIMSRLSVRNIDSYNKKIEDTPKEELEALFAQEIENDEMDPFELPDQLPYVVIVIDELADLMMVASKEVELSIARLTQMARAAGIHLLVATQRPSVDVLTGLIKANFPARISFQTSTKVDSRTILDSMGAEKLLGGGDMLFLKPGISRLIRIHGAYVSDQEIKDIVSYLREQGEPEYNEEILSSKKEEGDVEFQEEDDGLYEEAVNLVSKMKYASISMIQRRLRIGYNRAARMIEQMEAEGLVGPADGAKPREVLIHNPD
ncbi:MAG: DNA translocase FtsK [Deltaproteobacteria bacterium]|nr:DNA translocase FtsK [Deltaproteobacteria bacterium]